MDLSRAAKKKLGRDLVNQASRTVRELILERGGNAGNVREAAHWADRTLAEAAEAATKGDRSAAKAIKIVKNAKRLGKKY